MLYVPVVTGMRYPANLRLCTVASVITLGFKKKIMLYGNSNGTLFSPSSHEMIDTINLGFLHHVEPFIFFSKCMFQ